MFRYEGKKITHLDTTLQLWQQQRALGGFDSDTAGDGATSETPVRAEEMPAQLQLQSLRSTREHQHQQVVQI